MPSTPTAQARQPRGTSSTATTTAAIPAPARRAPAATCVAVSQPIEGVKPPSSLSTAAAPVAHSTTERRPRRSARTRARSAGSAESSTDANTTPWPNVRTCISLAAYVRVSGKRVARKPCTLTSAASVAITVAWRLSRRCGGAHQGNLTSCRVPPVWVPPVWVPPVWVPPVWVPPVWVPPVWASRNGAPSVGAPSVGVLTRAFPSEWRSGRASSHDHQGRPTVSSTT